MSTLEERFNEHFKTTFLVGYNSGYDNEVIKFIKQQIEDALNKFLPVDGCLNGCHQRVLDKIQQIKKDL